MSCSTPESSPPTASAPDFGAARAELETLRREAFARYGFEVGTYIATVQAHLDAAESLLRLQQREIVNLKAKAACPGCEGQGFCETGSVDVGGYPFTVDCGCGDGTAVGLASKLQNLLGKERTQVERLTGAIRWMMSPEGETFRINHAWYAELRLRAFGDDEVTHG